jgi:pimeloyl-ACP methyl ester carboxylesterase
LPDRDTPVPADQPIPTVDFVRPRLFEDPVLSPDGKYFAARTKSEDLKPSIIVCEIATGKLLWGYRYIYSFDWISSRHLNTDKGFVGKTGDLKQGFQVERKEEVYDVFDPDHPQPPEDIFHYKYGLMAESGYLRKSKVHPEPDFPGIQIERRWYAPEDGRLSYCELWRNDGKKLLYRFDGHGWMECPVNIDEITPVEIGQKPNEMIVLGPGGNGQTRAIQRMDVVTGQLGEIIYRDPHFDCLPWVIFKRGTREIVGVTVAALINHNIWLSPTRQQAQELIDLQFKGSLAQIVSADVSDTKFLITVESDRQPPVYYFLDWEKKSFGRIKDTSPWIDPARMNPTRTISYKTRDGHAIEGYLTLPGNASKEHPAPLVVVCGAGPWRYRFSWGWDEEYTESQFLSSRGYAVFRPNFRGSLGTDSRFSLEDRFAFQKMGYDIADGVKALSKTGMVNSKRVAAYGIGFGSYLALSAALEQPGLYQCAIVYGGVFDWDKAFARKDARNWGELRWLQQRLKDYGQHAISPLDHPRDLQIPIFFARNLFVRDVTIESQAWDMLLQLKSDPRCMSFGDLNLYVEEEAYSEMVDRMDKIDRFLGQYLKSN